MGENGGAHSTDKGQSVWRTTGRLSYKILKIMEISNSRPDPPQIEFYKCIRLILDVIARIHKSVIYPIRASFLLRPIAVSQEFRTSYHWLLWSSSRLSGKSDFYFCSIEVFRTGYIFEEHGPIDILSSYCIITSENSPPSDPIPKIFSENFIGTKIPVFFGFELGVSGSNLR